MKDGAVMCEIYCKICGKKLKYKVGDSVIACPYCDNKRTLPKIEDEQSLRNYNTATEDFFKNEFDRAEAVYRIITDTINDADLYWSRLLCDYKKKKKKRDEEKWITIMNRFSYDSVYDNENYKDAINNSDDEQREIFESEASVIEKIRKKTQNVLSETNPVDVFISYKESSKDHDGIERRTNASVLAGVLYERLNSENLKVFYAPVSLKDKAGDFFEPYIYSAIHSAKVMVVLGTESEHFTSPWVRNEWSRYLSVVKESNNSKKLICALCNMSPNDLPEELKKFQVVDMKELNWLANVEQIIVGNVGEREIKNPKLRRIFRMIGDGNFKKAAEYLDGVNGFLGDEPENPLAYLGLLMIDLEVKNPEELPYQPVSFEKNEHYIKALEFGGQELKQKLERYNEQFKETAEQERKKQFYSLAKKEMENANSERSFRQAAEKFREVAGFEDADQLAKICLDRAEEFKNENVYNEAIRLMKKHTIESLTEAKRKFETIKRYEDSREKINQCDQEIEAIKKDILKKERDAIERKARREIVMWWINAHCLKIILTVSLLLNALFVRHIINMNGHHQQELKEMQSDYEQQLLNQKEEFEERKKTFEEEMNQTISDLQAENELLQNELDGLYENYKNVFSDAEYEIQAISNSDIGDTVYFGTYEQDGDESNGSELVEWIVLDKQRTKALLLGKYGINANLLEDDEFPSAIWENSKIRFWLNDGFYNTAFSEPEKEKVIDTNLKTEHNPLWESMYDYTNLDLGNDTIDKVFLLSIQEVNDYFASDEERVCYVYDSLSIYRKKRETTDAVNPDYPVTSKVFWWLRSPHFLYASSNPSVYSEDGINDMIESLGLVGTALLFSSEYDCAAFVDITGECNSLVMPNPWSPTLIRPAMWVDLTK